MPLGALADAAMLARVRPRLRLFAGRYCRNRILSATEVQLSKHLRTGAAAFPHKRVGFLFFSAGFDCVAVSA